MRVVAGVIFHQNQVLMALRAHGDWAGYWEFPGGKTEPQESDEETLIREIKEELNLEIEVQCQLGEYFHQAAKTPITLVVLIAQAKSRHFDLIEHREARWMGINELERLRLAPADLGVVPKLREWVKTRESSRPK